MASPSCQWAVPWRQGGGDKPLGQGRSRGRYIGHLGPSWEPEDVDRKPHFVTYGLRVLQLSLHFLGNRRSERVDLIGDLRFQGLWEDVYKKVVSIYCKIFFLTEKNVTSSYHLYHFFFFLKRKDILSLKPVGRII